LGAIPLFGIVCLVVAPEAVFLIYKPTSLYKTEESGDEGRDIDEGRRKWNGYCDVEEAAG